MHIITQKVSKKYMNKIRKEGLFSPSGKVRNLRKCGHCIFSSTSLPFWKTRNFLFHWCRGCWRHKEIMSCMWSSFPERPVWPQKTERTDFHMFELSRHNHPLMSCCFFSSSSICSSKYLQPLSDDKLPVRLMDQKWRDAERKKAKGVKRNGETKAEWVAGEEGRR